jgi:hypothetical protein
MINSHKYQDIICLFENDDEESVTIVFKDRSQIAFSADTPAVRAGLRALLFDRLGLLAKNELRPFPSTEPIGLSR